MEKIEHRKSLRDFPEKERLQHISQKDVHGNTLLYSALNQPERLKDILKSLPKAERLLLITEKNRDGLMILDQLLKQQQPKALEEILDALPPSMRLGVLLTPLESGKTLLKEYAEQPDTLARIVSLLPEEQQAEALASEAAAALPAQTAKEQLSYFKSTDVSAETPEDKPSKKTPGSKGPTS